MNSVPSDMAFVLSDTRELLGVDQIPCSLTRRILPTAWFNVMTFSSLIWDQCSRLGTADFGRTFVRGNDPFKKNLKDSFEPTWNKVKARFQDKLSMTEGELYSIACAAAQEAGWELVGSRPGTWQEIFRREHHQG